MFNNIAIEHIIAWFGRILWVLASWLVFLFIVRNPEIAALLTIALSDLYLGRGWIEEVLRRKEDQ